MSFYFIQKKNRYLLIEGDEEVVVAGNRAFGEEESYSECPD